jgi:hypothetical protein
MAIIIEQDTSKLSGEGYDFAGMFTNNGQLYAQGYIYGYMVNESLFMSKTPLSTEVLGELERYTHAQPWISQLKPSIKAYIKDNYNLDIVPTTKF